MCKKETVSSEQVTVYLIVGLIALVNVIKDLRCEWE